jgi:hypothetical protein
MVSARGLKPAGESREGMMNDVQVLQKEEKGENKMFAPACFQQVKRGT